MPPIIALTLCAALVALLLLIERTRYKEASLALWVPTLWLLISASRPLGRWFLSAPISAAGDIEAGSFLDRLVLGILILLAVVTLSRRKLDWSLFLKNNFWLVLVLLYMGISVLWSEITFSSFKRWVKTAGDIPVALVVLSEQKPLQALESVLRRCAYVLIPLSLVLIKYYPHLAVAYGRWSGGQMWCGVSLQKNQFGQLCALSIFILFWSLVRDGRSGNLLERRSQTLADLFVISVGGYLLLGCKDSYSATSLGMLILGVAMLLALCWRKGMALYLVKHLKGFLVSVVFIYWVLHESVVEMIAPIFSRDETFTGRTDIWRLLLEFASRNPILGTGYGGFWAPGNRELEREFTSQFILTNAHNGYLAVYTELGIVGLVLLAGFLLAYCGIVRRELNHSFEWGVYGICLLPMSLLCNISETSFLQSPNYLWSTLVFLTVVFSAPILWPTESDSV
jgi:exopolysaccharide production protein ExoQ